MGHSQADKAHNRERILQAAAAQIRQAGLDSVSVAGLMRSVGLTHGGFYGHFESRSELLALALQRALDDGRAASQAVSRRAGRPQPAQAPAQPRAAADALPASLPADDTPPRFDAFVRAYLSRAHRDAPQQGCAVAALAADVARADEPARTVMSQHIDAFIQRIAAAQGAAPGDGAAEDEAMFAVSALVGGLLLSRVAADPKRSDAILRAVRQGLIDRQG